MTIQTTIGDARAPHTRRPPASGEGPAAQSPRLSAAWAVACERLAAARAAVTDLTATRAGAKAAVEAEAPAPEVLFNKTTGLPHECKDAFLKNERIPFETRARMLAAWEDWKPRVEAARARQGLEPDSGDDPALMEAWDALDDALSELLEQTPPDLNGLLLQVRASIELEFCNDGDDPDSEAMMCRMLSGGGDAKNAALLYRAALRLAGKDSPALAAIRFDPAAWVATFEAVPGATISSTGPAWTEALLKRIDWKEAPGHADWKRLAPWQQKAVRDYARARDR